MTPDQQSRLMKIEQQAQASLPEAIDALRAARIRVAASKSEVDRLDRALDEARFRKQRLTGSRHQYLETRVQELTKNLLGEESAEQISISDPRDDLADAAGLQGVIDLLQRRRADEVQNLEFANVTARQAQQRAYELSTQIAAVEYEKAREDIAAKWARTQAMAELSGTGPTCDLVRWSALHLPSITLDKFFRTNPHAVCSSPITPSLLDYEIRRTKIQARERLDSESEPDKRSINESVGA